LIVGTLLSLMGLTGAALVFVGPMTRMEIGYDLFASGRSPFINAPVDDWIANAHRAYGGLNAVEFVSGPGYGFGGGTTLMARTAEGKHSVVSIDPDTGVPLANFIWDDTYSTSILKFHARLGSLLSGASVGRTLTASIMFGGIVLTSISLYLWWPRQGNWRTAFMPLRGARGLRRWLDLHNLAAVYLIIPLVVLGLTGVYLANPGVMDSAVALTALPRIPDPEALARTAKPGSCASRTTPGQAVALARARFPSARFVSLAITTNQPYVVKLASPNNVGDKGQTQVFVDRECPVVLTAIDGEIRVGAETFRAVMHPLHRYLMLGYVGMVIAFLAGLLVPASFVTALSLWLSRR